MDKDLKFEFKEGSDYREIAHMDPDGTFHIHPDTTREQLVDLAKNLCDLVVTTRTRTLEQIHEGMAKHRITLYIPFTSEAFNWEAERPAILRRLIGLEP